MDQQQVEGLVELSGKILDALSKVDEAVRADTQDRAADNRNTEAIGIGPNMMSGTGGIRAAVALNSIRSTRDEDYRRIAREPFVARVVVEDENGGRRVYYFGRAMPFNGTPEGLDGTFAGYHSGIGRIAELPVGAETTLRIRGEEVTFSIVQRVQLTPGLRNREWDGFEDRIEGDGRAVKLPSLRSFIQNYATPPEPEDVVALLEAEDQLQRDLAAGLRRSIVSRMALRDQPLLDQYQGEVFRLPLDRRLMLFGPPGTGKTTTLIKRVAQKTRAANLSEEELAIVPEPEQESVFRSDRWVMFTPTELLRLYVKEAFAQESVAASDERIQVWQEYRRRLARDVLRILRSGTSGRFVLIGGPESETETLAEGDSRALVGLLNVYDHWFRERTTAKYANHLRALTRDGDPDIARLAARVQRVLGGEHIDYERIFDMPSLHGDISKIAEGIQAEVDRAIKDHQNRQIARDRAVLDRIRTVLDQTAADENDAADGDDEDDEDLDATSPLGTRSTPASALRAWKAALRRKAKEAADGRVRTRTGSTPRVLAALAAAAPEEAFLREVGAQSILLERLRFLGRTYANLTDALTSSYQVFRRAMLREEHWYRRDSRAAIEKGLLCGAEVDILALLILRNVRTFFARDGFALLRSGGDTRVAILDSVRGEYFTQVLVDEATDFSAPQLACMLELTHPRVRSFFASGDARQRVTSWGIRSIEELREYVAADIELREVSQGYRQSRRLADLAELVAGGVVTPSDSNESEDGDIPPALGEDLKDYDLAAWLRARITEVTGAVGQTPSIAIFVDGEERIDPLVAALSPLLAQVSLEVIACRNGQVVGKETQIRVFDVKHIKGMEFEAVFFVGVDALARSKPDLFDKFLYVGLTRAATYLGLCCEGSLPLQLEPLRERFTNACWAAIPATV